MLKYLPIILIGRLFGLTMFAVNGEPLNEPLTWILAPLAGLGALGFLISLFLPLWWFIRILTPRTANPREHPLAQALRSPASLV
jgi:hypothetical protein